MKWLESDHWLLPDGRHLRLCKARVLGVGPGTFADYTGSTTDGFIYNYNSSYATARSTSGYIYTSDNYTRVGQAKAEGLYFVYRCYLEFDTSAIADDAVISDVKLYLKVYGDSSATDFTIQIFKFDWASPIASGNREANYDAAGALYDQDWRSTSGVSVGSWYANSTSLDTDWVDVTGTTRYMLKSEEDTNNSAPTGLEYLDVYASESSGNEPYLAVTYTESIEQSQQFQWDLRNEVAGSEQFQWDLRNDMADVQQFQWDIGAAIAKAQQFQWDIGASITKSQQFQWDLTRSISKSQQFRWNLGTTQMNAVMGMPDLEIEVSLPDTTPMMGMPDREIDAEVE